MVTTIEFALMSGRAYQTTRDPLNQFSIPQGWLELAHVPNNPDYPMFTGASGFEAVSFQNTANPNEIVISYAGTDPGDITGDIAADIGLATGFDSDQLLQAAEYYLAVKAANPDANITFTGHSLGGGLAALMGVFFSRQAVTFDQAPFAESAEWSLLHPDVAANLKQYLSDKALTDPALVAARDDLVSNLDNFLTLRQTFGGIPNSNLVTGINVQGEFLSSAPATLFDRVGAQSDILNSANGVSGTDLHSQSLLTAYLQSQQTAATGKALNDVTYKLTDLLGMMFDDKLFYYDPNNKDNPQRNLLEHLVRHEAGIQGSFSADAMLTRFTTDLWKIAQDGGLTLTDANVAKTLTAFAMQMYYENHNATDASKQLFSDIDVSGGIRFNREDVAASLSDAKGYGRYFLAYLQENFTGSELDKIIPSLPDLKDWYIQAGTNSLNATDTQNRGAFMLGGAGDDWLTGGSQADLLVGNAGADTQTGGSGKDTLIGGTGDDTLNGLDEQGGDYLAGGIGNDTYYADNGDIIYDEDGIGTVYVGQSRTRLLGGERKADEALFASADKSQVYRENSDGSIDVWTPDGHITIQPSPGNPGPRAQPTSDGSPGVQSGQPGMGLPLISPKPKDPPFNPPYAGAGDAVCPLIFDLDGNGVQVTNLADGVYFDHDGNGFVESTAWVGGGDGLLAWDKNNDGKITTGNELFGDRTLMKNGRWGQNGFDVLAEYDDNQDGKIDANDAVWSNLQLWVDANHNGISLAAELHSLSEYGIQSINTAYVSEQEIDGITQRGSYTKTDGSQANAVDDRRFVADFVDTKVMDWVPVTPEIEALPDIQGYGNVYDLRQAMARDASGELMNLVKQFGLASNTLVREELLTQILFKWTDSDQIDPHSRDNLAWGTSFDGRKLAVLEKFNGVPFFQPYAETGPDANPIWEAIPLLNQSYSALCGMMYSQLMAQTHLKWLYDKVTFAWDETSQSVKANQDSVIGALVNLLATDRPKGIETIVEYAQSLADSPSSSVMDIGHFIQVLVPQGDDVSGALEEVVNIAFPGENISGDEGDNTLVGTLGGDFISGRDGDDILGGGYGADYLFGEGGNDTLDGGSGNDYLNGGSGNDTYLFGRGYGQDTISEYDATAGNSDTIRLAADVTPNDVSMGRNVSDLFIRINGANDMITMQNWFVDPAYRVERVEFSDGTVWDASIMQAAIFRGTDAADYIYGTLGNEVIEGFGGDDSLTGGEGNDTLDGGIGNDTLDGGTGNDTYLFGRGYGQDTISDYDATAGNIDTIRLAAGISASDVTLSRDASSLYLGINGTSDRITVQSWFSGADYRVERVEFADGTVWDEGTLAQAPIVGTADNDYLQGGAGDDVYLFGRGNGQDTITDFDYANGGGQDTIRLAADINPTDVTLSRDTSSLYLSINGTSDSLTISNWYGGTNYRVERMEFADGTVWDAMLLANAPYLGSDGADYLSGANGNETFIGGSGDDTLYGNGGGDVLDGGTGDDALVGGAGDDTYVFGRGYGQDTITDFDYANGGGQDTIRLAADINPADVTLSRDASSLYLSINGTSDRLTISNWYSGANYRVERMEFADGTVWDATLLANAPYIDSGLPGSIPQIPQGEISVGQNSDDTLYGNGGNDVLDGGLGYDTLQGGAGDDVYLFGRGYGRDTITDFDSANGGGQDTIRLAADINPADVTLSRDASSLYLSINSTSDRLTVSNWFSGTNYRVERMEFADGTVWDAMLLANAPYLGTDGADYLPGTNDNETFIGGGGDDMLYGNGGNDVLDGGLGYDTLQGGAGDDVYLFGRGYGRDVIYDFDYANGGGQDTIRLAADINPADVTLSRDASSLCLSINGTSDRLTVSNWYSGTNYRVERMEFADGTVWDATLLANAPYLGTDGSITLSGSEDSETLIGLGGNDMLYGNGGNDILSGGTGNDSLDGGAGDDTYLFGRGYGRDTISEYDPTAGKSDTILLKPDVVPGDVTLWRDASSLYLGINGTNDTLTVQGWYDDPAYRVEQIEFADGMVWNAATLAAAKFVGTDAADYLYGTAGADVMEGLGGDDSLSGGEGDDTLDGGTGNDALDGGTGNDTYVFGRGYGQDTISDYDATAGNIDTIRLAAGISASDVTLSRDASSLYLGINGTSDRITVQNWFADPVYRAEQIEFADGTVWDTSLMQAAKFSGTDAADYIAGTTGNDVIEGLGDDDSLTGVEGDDTLDGGTGNDALDGGTGNDTYLFGHGSGQDTISDYDTMAGNSDTILLKPDVVPGDVTLWRDTSNLYLGINGTSDGIMVQSWFDDPAYRVEQVQFADGTIWDAAKLQQSAVFLGTAGADALYGTAQDETIDGLGGDDTIYGGAGNDTYLFGHGSGQDTISDYDATAGNIDTIRLAAGISASDVTLSRDASNLYLGINGTSDRIMMQSWFDDPAYRVEQVQLDDGTVWDAVLLQAAKFLGTEAADYLVGVAGNNNTVEGLGGDDTILGDMGNDILDGGAGNDSLTDAAGNDLLMGKAGDDALTGDAGNGLYIGGSGNDTITVGSGSNIIAFNRGDGQDIVNIGTGNDALSLGRGISYTDLAFRKTVNDLILDTGAGESITLKDWFAAPSSHGVVTLQVIAESMPGFDPQSVGTLLSQKVQDFDFSGLASRFDAAQAADPTMTSWNLMNGLLDAHLASSDTAALGGDLAYQYGLSGSLAGIGLAAAQDVLAAPQFGSQAQTLRPWSSLNSGTVQLS